MPLKQFADPGRYPNNEGGGGIPLSLFCEAGVHVQNIEEAAAAATTNPLLLRSSTMTSIARTLGTDPSVATRNQNMQFHAMSVESSCTYSPSTPDIIVT